MGCLMVLFAFVTPRFIMVVLWVFTDYLSRSVRVVVFWPLLGFFFLPTTTMALRGGAERVRRIDGWGLVVLVLGIMVDFGLLGGGGRAMGRRSRRLITRALAGSCHKSLGVGDPARNR